MNTQASRLLNHLQSGQSITRLSALTELGIFELSARIIDLENMGHVIHRHRIEVENRFGEKVRVAEYWIESQKVAA